jgi:hypothetical protein
VNAKRLWRAQYDLKARLPLPQDFVMIWNSNTDKFEILSVFGKQILGNPYKILRIRPNTDKRSRSN